MDELSCYFDSPAEPNNMHLELWLPGHLDESRLREAVAATLASQPPRGSAGRPEDLGDPAMTGRSRRTPTAIRSRS